MDPARLIVSHAWFDQIWPFAADALERRWRERGAVIRLQDAAETPRLITAVADEAGVPLDRVECLAALECPLDSAALDRLPSLQVAAVLETYGDGATDPLRDACAARKIRLVSHGGEAFWGQSVAEFGLAMTLNALRAIPQKHASIRDHHDAWELDLLRPRGDGAPGGHQFADDPAFVNGTLAGKRVRVVGIGNIGGRYAKFCQTLGADVAAWHPFAPEASFALAGVRREHDLARLVADADIFAPMLPLTKDTRGLVTAELVSAVPKGAIFVVVTRMGILDAAAVRERVMANEIALAADVFDVEPLPLDDPLLGRPNVIHTPHIAGRTRDANEAWAELLDARFI